MNRPGVSSTMLSRAGVRHVDAVEARSLVGYSSPGLLLPYITRNGDTVTIDGKPFARLRLDNPTNSAKYLSPAKSGCQLYEPPGLRDLLMPGCTLGITEGEFKALSQVEAGFPCVGIGGITSACPGGALLPALAGLITEVRPSKIAFIGDGDTCLIYDFAREAVKLAGLCSLPVVLPRIPIDAPGKGPDDLREAWGHQFPSLWQAILDAAESVTPSTKPPALAVRLLRREGYALAKIEGDAREKACDRLVKLAASVSSDALAIAEVEQIAAAAFGIRKTDFRSAVKARAEELKAAAARRAAEDAIASLDADGTAPLYFDGGAYWRKEDGGNFGKLCREDARLHINKAGLSKHGDPAPCDAALHKLQVRNRVEYAGPLCGRPAGLHYENGLRVLATRGPSWIEGKAGESPNINALLGNLLGRAEGDEYATTQAAIFISWLKLARDALRHPEQHRPGHVLALVGPQDCGKSLLQSAIITPALGGREADPGLYLTGQTTFNADLWHAEHLALGDKALDVEGKQRAALRDGLKQIVAAPLYPLHGKCRDGLNFRPVWRLTVSANDDPESASNLPTLDASFADKIIYLKCYAPPAPFFDADAPDAREAFAAKLREELPAFLAAVDSFAIPAELCKTRYGVAEWHHPAVLDLLEDGDPLRPIEDILRRWICLWNPSENVRELPTTELFQKLDDCAEGNLNRHKICSGPIHLGRQLAKLAALPAWSGKLVRTSRRVGGREVNQERAYWRVTA